MGRMRTRRGSEEVGGMECKDCKFYTKPRVYAPGGGCKTKSLEECPGYQETLRWGFKPRQQDDEREEGQR